MKSKFKVISKVALVLLLSLFMTSCNLLDPGGYGEVEDSLGTVVTKDVKGAVNYILDVEAISERYIEGYIATNQGEQLRSDGKTFVLSETPDSEGCITVVTMLDTDIDPSETSTKLYFKVDDSVWIEDGVYYNVGPVVREKPSNWSRKTISYYLGLVEKINSTKLKVSGYYDSTANCLTAEPGGVMPRKLSIAIDIPDNDIPDDTYITVIGNLKYNSNNIYNCEIVEGNE